MNNSSPFQRRVLNLTKKISKGEVTTYKILAQKLGQSRATRAVGQALNKNLDLIKIPCHRVVKSDGNLGGYKGGLKRKAALLKREGIEIENNKVVVLEKFLYKF